VILVVALMLSALDGYDTLSMAFVAPVVAREWHLTKDVIGVLLASSLGGMALGAIFLSPFADRFGRRAAVFGALLLLIVGTVLSAASGSVPLLAGARLLTGIGIGVMVAMTTLIAAEFSNVQRRSVAVASVATLGFPMGGILGGLASSAIFKYASWHWVFLTGSLSGAAMLTMVALVLPESPVFIIARSAPGALERVNHILRGLGQPVIAELPRARDRRDSHYGALFTPTWRGMALRLAGIGILMATSSYYILNWLPQMVTDAGFTAAQGSLVSALSGVVGVFGGVGFAAFAARFTPTRVAVTAMIGVALGFVTFGLAPPVIPAFVATAGLFGFCLAGATGMLYTIMADAFPAALRASGMGLIMGSARVVSASGPALAGVMFAHGMTRAGVSLTFALGPLAAAALMGTYRHRTRVTA
jgi:MFS family permease